MVDNLEIIDRIKGNKNVKIVRHDDILDNETKDFIENLKTAIDNNTLVPVICEDLYEYESPNNERQSLHSFLVQQALDKCKNQIELTEDELHDIVLEGYYGMRMLEKKLVGKIGGNKLHKIIYSSIMRGANRISPDIHLKKEVVDFLNVCSFPLIITTNCFPIIENELESSYGQYYTKNNTNSDLQRYSDMDIHKYENRSEIPSRCVYHIFGEASSANSNWGYSDVQILNHLRTAMGVTPWSNLTAALENKNLFIIGNNTPDWLFRFILTPIFGSNVYYHDGYYLNSGKEDRHLIYFLSDITFSNALQMDYVLGKITEEIREKRGVKSRIEGNRHGKKYDIFLAHAGEDKSMVKKLEKCLVEEHKLKVFIDYSEIQDGNYWKKIINGIMKSAYFMPFITKTYIDKAEEYLDKEFAASASETIELALNFDWDSPLIDETKQRVLEKVWELSRKTNGVATELLLAEKWLSAHPQDPYSIPIIQNGRVWLTPNHVETRMNPSRLFCSQQARMYYDGKQDPFDGKFDYDRYKYNNL